MPQAGFVAAKLGFVRPGNRERTRVETNSTRYNRHTSIIVDQGELEFCYSPVVGSITP